MLLLPKSTEFNRRVPKHKFYEKLSVTPEIKQAFVEQISVIYWRNKLAATTLNVGQGERVMELEVFEIKLNQPNVNTKILQLIDTEIPYHILYILEYNGECQAWIGYKEPSTAKTDTFKVNSYYHTNWMTWDELPIYMSGLHLDEIYDNFIWQIAGERLRTYEKNKPGVKIDIKSAIEHDNMRKKLNKQITAFESRMENEKQFNKQVKLNAELKKLKKELEELG